MTPHERFVKEAREELLLRGVRVTSKDEMYALWRVLDIALKIVSLGKFRTFLTKTTTTVGKTIFFPVGWKEEKANTADYITLRHEIVHTQQFEEMGDGVTWLGVLLFGLLYLFCPLPIGLAWCRYKFEREAYLESARVIREFRGEPNIEKYITILSGPSYLWAWPFKDSIRKWFYQKLHIELR